MCLRNKLFDYLYILHTHFDKGLSLRLRSGISCLASGQSFDKHASELQAPFRTEKAVNPKTIRRPRSVIAGPDVTLHCQGDQ